MDQTYKPKIGSIPGTKTETQQQPNPGTRKTLSGKNMRSITTILITIQSLWILSSVVQITSVEASESNASPIPLYNEWLCNHENVCSTYHPWTNNPTMWSYSNPPSNASGPNNVPSPVVNNDTLGLWLTYLPGWVGTTPPWDTWYGYVKINVHNGTSIYKSCAVSLANNFNYPYGDPDVCKWSLSRAELGISPDVEQISINVESGSHSGYSPRGQWPYWERQSYAGVAHTDENCVLSNVTVTLGRWQKIQIGDGSYGSIKGLTNYKPFYFVMPDFL